MMDTGRILLFAGYRVWDIVAELLHVRAFAPFALALSRTDEMLDLQAIMTSYCLRHCIIECIHDGVACW
jgi:hypothetical protein